MNDVVALLNRCANACGEYVFAPIDTLPGWLSATLIAAVTGVFMLLVFKYTSNQQAIGRVRNGIKANLLALSLFKDSVGVSLRCQARILGGAFRLLFLAIVPILVMTIPMCLLLAQLALWYQTRPLRVGEETVVTVHFSGDVSETPEIQMASTPAATVTAGPVRAPDEQMVCWRLLGETEGIHDLTFTIGKQHTHKQLAVGDGFERVSLRRPTEQWSDALMHPAEMPFSVESQIQAIDIDYPTRGGWTCGSNWWIVYWFIASMVAAFCVRAWLNVNI
jgi:hypothetical protein